MSLVASAPRSEVLLTLSALLRALCAPCARVKDIARDQLSSGATRWDTARVKITKYTPHGIISSVLSPFLLYHLEFNSVQKH